jgi:RIO kinase 1
MDQNKTNMTKKGSSKKKSKPQKMSLADFNKQVDVSVDEVSRALQEATYVSLQEEFDLNGVDREEQERILLELQKQSMSASNGHSNTSTSDDTNIVYDVQLLGDVELARLLQEQEDFQLAQRINSNLHKNLQSYVKQDQHAKVKVDYGYNHLNHTKRKPTLAEDDYELDEDDNFDEDFEEEYDEEEYDELDQDDDSLPTEPGDQPATTANSQPVTTTTKKLQPAANKVLKYSSRINLDYIENETTLGSGGTGSGGSGGSKSHVVDVKISSSVKNTIQQAEKKELQQRIRIHGKQDRATTEQVLDPRTRMILYKMINNGTVYSINGCVSTGKEANVYYATGPNNEDYAIKVYKTSILVFKDRDRYVTGEFRFRRGYSKHNPRKMVRVWAEKEMRNLKRIEIIGIPCPQPILLRQHVLLMTFIGKQGWPAPRLKEITNLSPEKYKELYLEIIKNMRIMYHEAKLVHADLSEYNMLYFKGQVYFIDVSQSVEHDHPHALEFLRKDCSNIRDFFIRRGLTHVMTTRETFEFITDITITRDTVDEFLKRTMELVESRPAMTDQEAIDEEVFKKVFIPRTLVEVSHYEDHVEEGSHANTDEVFYRSVTGLNMDLTGAQDKPAILHDYDEEEDEEDENDDELSENENESTAPTNLAENIKPEGTTGEEGEEKSGLPDLSKMDKKERKKFVKEMNREKRQNKIPKHVKKRYKKVAQVKKGHKPH